MLYFKNAPISPSKIDVPQFAALQSFRSALPAEGCLYSQFEDSNGFEASLRAHLSAIAQKFAARPAATYPAKYTKTSQNEVLALTSDDDYGLLDWIEIFTDRSLDMTGAMTVINDATVRVGEQLTTRAAELQTSGGDDSTHQKQKVKRASEDLVRYANTLESQVLILASARQDAFGALSSAMPLMTDFPSDIGQLHSLKAALCTTIENASIAAASLTGMRNAASGLPRVSKDLNKAKRVVIENLDKFLAEIDSTKSTVTNIIAAMDRLLSNSSPNG
jgi:hypothetical protein